jgi:class 3 adenylate cyclase
MGEENSLINISAIGDEVNTAARIASKAATGEILVSTSALQAAGINDNQLETRSLELKGISAPVTVRVLRS